MVFTLVYEFSFCLLFIFANFPGGAEVKASACNLGDLGSIPGSGRSPGEGNGNPLQYSCLENPMDGRRLVGYSPPVAKSRTQLSNFTFTFTYEYYYWQTLWFSLVVCCFYPFTTVCLFHIFMMDYKLILFGHNLVTEQHFRNSSMHVLEAWVSSVFLKKCFVAVFSRCLGDSSLWMFSHSCTISVSEIRTLVNFIEG